MPGAGSWEVCLYSDFSNYEVWCKSFRSFRRARRFLKKVLRKNRSFYCATVSNDESTLFQSYYWTGQGIVLWDKPWALSRRQALSLGSNKEYISEY